MRATTRLTSDKNNTWKNSQYKHTNNDYYSNDHENTTYTIIILHITNNVLRQVIDETTTYSTWEKLQSLYIKRDLPNTMFLRERPFSYRMNSSQTVDENLDEFKRLISFSP